MSCDQCKGKTPSGHQCRRKVCKWAPYCHDHTPVEAKASSYGIGMFAKRDIAKHTKVSDYSIGTRRVAPGTTGMYVWCGNTKKCHDAVNKKKSIAGNFNRGNTSAQKNAKIKASGAIVTTKRIKSGSQLLVSYGSSHKI